MGPPLPQPDPPFTYAAYERAGVAEAWLVHPTDHVVIVYTLNADGVYGKPAIHETTETLAPGLFPDLLVEWGLIFPDTPVRPSPLPTKDLP